MQFSKNRHRIRSGPKPFAVRMRRSLESGGRDVRARTLQSPAHGRAAYSLKAKQRFSL